MVWQKLISPPIKEAVLDLRFLPNENISIEILEKLSLALKKQFPLSNRVFLFTKTVSLNKEDKGQIEQSNNGFRLFNKERSLVLKIEREGLALSKLSPYISWEEIKDVTNEIFPSLLNLIPDIKIKRLALRYINEFKIEFEDDIMNNNLNLLPTIPQNLPNAVDEYSIKLVLPKESKNLKGIVNHIVTPYKAKQGTYNIILDIDVFKEQEYFGKDFDEILKDFEDIRDYKNEIFLTVYLN